MQQQQLWDTPREKHQKYDDAELEALSKEQRQLRIQLTFVTDDKKRESLKPKRNRIQHKVRKLCLDRAEEELDLKAKEVEKLKNGAQMFKAVATMRRRPAVTTVVQDKHGKLVGRAQEAVAIVKEHFQHQFTDKHASAIEPFIGEP